MPISQVSVAGHLCVDFLVVEFATKPPRSAARDIVREPRHDFPIRRDSYGKHSPIPEHIRPLWIGICSHSRIAQSGFWFAQKLYHLFFGHALS